MKYKCDNCKHLVRTGPTEEQPYADQRCAKGHWSGVGEDIEYVPKSDPWKDCADFRARKTGRK